MNRRKKIFFIIGSITFVLLCVLPQNSFAQSKKVDRTVEKRQEQLKKQLEKSQSEINNKFDKKNEFSKKVDELKKQEEIKKEKSAEQMEARRQKHIDIQTKEVQKRMKRSKRKSKRINDNRKESFLSRWFRK